MASDGNRRRMSASVAASAGLLSRRLEASLRARGLAVEPLSPGRPPTRTLKIAIIGCEALGRTPAEAAAALAAIREQASALILVGTAPAEVTELASREAHAWLPLPLDEVSLITAVRSALATTVMQRELRLARGQIAVKEAEAQSLYEIGTALSAERDINRLQELILLRCRELTCADGGSLYLLDEDADGRRMLLFQTAQNDSVAASYERLTMPLTDESIAGYVALTGQTLNLPDVYQIPPNAPYHHNRSFDQQMGYRSKSMLVVPMRSHEGEIIGVIQLINRKRSFRTRLHTPRAAERQVISFTAESERVLDAFAGQAAVTLDNRLLLENIERLFEGFVRASVTAIEARDPTTSGHSERVAELTVGLASVVTAVGTGRWRDVGFTEQQLREMRWAGLLHDFGKIGVREHVLTKARKLYDWQLEVIRSRFAYARKALEAEHHRRRLDAVLEGGTAALAALDAQYQRQIQELDEILAAIVGANEPGHADPETLRRLADVGRREYLDVEGLQRSLIEPTEILALSVPMGSLTAGERQEIESHVSHTFRFLSLMPWTRSLRQLPLIAGAHHEKLDGSGYPRGLKGDDIPIQSRMMTIADMYDALTAADRPYRQAMSVVQALDVLHQEVRSGHLDASLLDLFVRRRVYERTTR